MTGPKAIFLDRDGTLNEDVDYLSRVADLRIYTFTRPALRIMKDAGYLLIVVTNQSGIGRGLYDATVLNAIHDEMQRQVDGLIDGFYFCPHLPSDGCECRKPKLGMYEAAIRDFGIDVAASWMIGDKEIDVEAGVAAGLRTAMVMTGYGRSEVRLVNSKPDLVVDNVLEAATDIVGR